MPPKRKAAVESVAPKEEEVVAPAAKKGKKSGGSVTIEHCKSWYVSYFNGASLINDLC